MNNQEAFDIMVNHLRKQNKKAVKIDIDGTTKCVYRGSNGLKCAIGCLIPDDEYSPLIERKGVRSLVIPTLRNLDREFLAEMQETHDFYSPEDWEKRFRYIAKEYHLTLLPKTV